MWSFIPAALGTGLVITAMASSKNSDSGEDWAHSILHNMAISHELAIAKSQETGFPVGMIQVDLAEPFVSLAAWKSEIVSDPSGRYLITWSGDFDASDAYSPSLEVVIARSGLPDSRRTAFNGRLLGRFLKVAVGTGQVGSVQIPVPRQAIANGTPAIVSLVR